MPRRPRLLLTSAFLVPLVLAVFSEPARADEDPRKVQAEPTFQEGVKLHEQKRFLEALEKFQKAYDIYPSPNTLVNIGREEQLLGRKLAALRHLREALKMPLLNPKSAAVARKYVSELEPLFGRVEVKGPAGLSLTVDGKSYRLPLSEPLDFEPGTVYLDGDYGLTRYRGRAVAIAGQSVTLEMASEQPPVAKSVAPASSKESNGSPLRFTPPPEPEGDKSFWTTTRAAGIAVGGLALVGAGIGTGFVFARQGHISDAHHIASANPRACVDAASPDCRSFKNAADATSAAETGAIASFIATGVLGVSSAALLLWPAPASGSSSTGVRARVAPTGRGVSVVGTF